MTFNSGLNAMGFYYLGSTPGMLIKSFWLKQDRQRNRRKILLASAEPMYTLKRRSPLQWGISYHIDQISVLK